MIRSFIFGALILHALAHLAIFLKISGFTAAFPFNERDESVIGKLWGILWLIAFLAFLTTAFLYFRKNDWYWIPAAIGLLISQWLIVVYWRDVKLMSIANVIILGVAFFGAARFTFDHAFRIACRNLLATTPARQRMVTEEDLRLLPLPVQRWLRQSDVVGKNTSNAVFVRQQGTMRLKPDAAWMSFESAQQFTIDSPSFVWNAHITASPFMAIGGRDKYEQGSGSMVIKPFYIFPLAHAKGAEVNQGTLLRYLAEMAWFPQAAVSPYLHWDPMDDHHARVTMRYKDVSASGVYTFNEEGLVSGFEARRFGEFDGEYRMETWSVRVTGYRTFGGRKIGNKAEVTWKLAGGDFLWMRMEVTSIEDAGG